MTLGSSSQTRMSMSGNTFGGLRHDEDTRPDSFSMNSPTAKHLALL